MKSILLFVFFLLHFFCSSQTENFWTKKGDFLFDKRERAVGFSIGNYGYMCSGVDTAELVLKDLWQYDPQLDIWTQKADLPASARRDAFGFAIEGIGYVGTGIDNDESFSGQKLNDFWAYDPIGNTWTQKANFPGEGGLGIYFATAFEMASKGYVCGGKSGPNNYTDEFWEYKPQTDSWSQRASFPGGVRYQMSSFAIGYKAYVGFGANQDVFKKDIWEYNGGNNQWVQKANLPASERGGASSFSIGYRGFVCIGNNGGLLDDVWEYNPFSDSWSVKAPFGGSPRKNAMSFVINNKAYVGTGKGYSGKKSSIFEYSPAQSVFLSIPEWTQANFDIYPNPMDDECFVKTNNLSVESFEICTLEGKKVMTGKIENQPVEKLNLSTLMNGYYLFVIKNKEGKTIGMKKISVN